MIFFDTIFLNFDHSNNSMLSVLELLYSHLEMLICRHLVLIDG